MNLKANVINVLTVLGIVLGMLAIAMNLLAGWLLLPAALILTSALIDLYDGRLARRHNLVSTVGAWLDLTNDLLSFAIAPVVFAHTCSLTGQPAFPVVVALFLLSALFRLRRYHLQSDSQVMQGLPTTVSGVVLTMVVVGFALSSFKGIAASWILYALMILLSILMVSSFRWRKS